MAITKKITVNGWVNIRAALDAIPYSGAANRITIYNPSATVPVYLHFHSSGATAPATGVDGLPILKDAPSAAFTLERPEAATCWLYTASSIDIILGVEGS